MDRVGKDIQRILDHKDVLYPLKGSRILVTGATGLIGSMFAKTIVAANEAYDLGIRVIGQVRDREKAARIFGDLLDRLELTDSYTIPCDHVLHTVSPTASKYFIEHPVETISVSVGSAMSVLEAARSNNADVVYLSSMEEYGVPYDDGAHMTEDKVGVIDHLNVRSSYPESKRLCECLCVSYVSEYGTDVKIARLAQTFGAGVPLSDNRMPMQFARAALEGRDIVLHTEGKSLSNIVYLSDAITGILTIMVRGEKGQAYNICNDAETRSVREIAQLVADEVAQSGIKVVVEKCDNAGYAPDVHMYLDSGKLRSLGWEPEVGMAEAYRRLTEYLKQCR